MILKPKTVFVKVLEYIMTHFIGFDFNSLYPSSFSGQYNGLNKYTDGIIKMPGRLLRYIKCDTEEKKREALEIIKEKKMIFIVTVKGGIPEKHWNNVINFAPIIRNIEFIQDEKTMGSYMYNYMKNNGLSVDNKVRKLTNLLNTYGENMVFYCYYLWFLMDECYFEIEDIEEISIFTSHTGFKGFVEKLTNDRQESIVEGNKGVDNFCKLNLNGSYGYDGMNEEKYTKTSNKR